MGEGVRTKSIVGENESHAHSPLSPTASDIGLFVIYNFHVDGKLSSIGCRKAGFCTNSIPISTNTDGCTVAN
ncbi:MAG TPA: hypothetical protein DD473_02060 [Planctomycetaceae bacterium]|nr:hypothetical protein [Planctomycetaceae bacterium]